jgi:hypothetical protein
MPLHIVNGQLDAVSDLVEGHVAVLIAPRCVRVPNSARDLDCKDVGHRVTVVGPDKYRLDGDDNDGKGCESYPAA